MAMPNLEQPSFDQVLRLVDRLSPEQQEQLRRKLNKKTWGQRWQALCDRVQERNKTLPPLSDQEIVAEIKAARKARRTQGV